jgi:hypothetical protein
MALERAAGLLSRLHCAGPTRLAGRIFQFALTQPGSWSSATTAALEQRLIMPPSDFGLSPSCLHSARRRYACHVRRALSAQDFARWRQQTSQSNDIDIQRYRCCSDIPRLADVHSWRISPSSAAAWCRLRSGCLSLGGDRVSRHTSGSSICRLCGTGPGDVAHAVLVCPALANPRADWRSALSNILQPGAAVPASGPELLTSMFASQQPSPALAAVHAAFAAQISAAHRARH